MVYDSSQEAIISRSYSRAALKYALRKSHFSSNKGLRRRCAQNLASGWGKTVHCHACQNSIPTGKTRQESHGELERNTELRPRARRFAVLGPVHIFVVELHESVWVFELLKAVLFVQRVCIFSDQNPAAEVL